MSTNQQSLVKEADRHSRNPLLVGVQEEIFRKYGYLVELKQGEFYHGRERGYLRKEYIIDRIIMLRAFAAFSGQPTPARSHSQPKLFESTFFNSVFPQASYDNLPQLAAEVFYACKIHSFLVRLEKKEGRKSLRYGYALRYGKYAVVYAAALVMDDDFRRDLSSRSLPEVEQYTQQSVPRLLNDWKNFEDKIQKIEENRSYFNPSENLTDFDTYYKGRTLSADLERYFHPRPNAC